MTAETLRSKPIGVLETRSFSFENKGEKYEESYCLVKLEDEKYYIGFSEDGSYCSQKVGIEDMAKMINDKEFSDSVASDIYFLDVHLSGWLD